MISLGKPYLNILHLAKLFVADAPIKKKKIGVTPSHSTLNYGSENSPWMKGHFDLFKAFVYI